MSARGEPMFFGPPERPLFGWLHRPGTPAAGVGLVLCNPFGYESICAHRSVRHFAEAAAAAGVPALRFDYDGTGDSAGTDRCNGRVGAWVASTRDAIDALRQTTGVQTVCVLGIRFGALIGALAAAGRDDVSGFIAVAPVVSGRAYLRELRALQMSLGLTAQAPLSATSPDEREALGFPVTAETQDALGGLDLVRQDVRPAARVLLFDREDLPTTDLWAERLRAGGAEVRQEPAQGYAETVLPPHKAMVPQAMIDVAIPWTRALGLPSRAIDAASLAEASATALLRGSAADPAIKETAVFLDEDRTLFGLLSAPVVAEGAAPPQRRGILLLNAGSIHHIGPNRLYVTLARRWAAQGHTVLRADVSGIGDSAPHPGEPENVVYSRHGVADVARAIELLRRQPGVNGCVVMGLCSGAYNAFKAAAKGQPIDAVVSINPLTFCWKEGMSLDLEFSPEHVTEDAQRYAQKVFSFASWKKLLRGDVNLYAVAQVVVRHGASLLAGRARDVARRLGYRFPDDLASELDEIARRGVGVHFLFARDEPGMDILRVQGGRAVTRLVRARKLEIDVIDVPGHTFTAVSAQDALIARLSAIVGDAARTRPAA